MRVAAFDIETTGIDYDRDEVVSASLVELKNGKFEFKEWLLKTNIESSPQALAKHGIEYATQIEHGTDYDETIIEITRTISDDYDQIITANGAFDLTMVQASFDRTNSEDYYDLSAIAMVDIMVLDKFMDKYRKGSRKLEDLARHYKVNFEGIPHNATFDATLTYGIYMMMVPMMQSAEKMGPELLPNFCASQYHIQRKELAEYFERIGKRATITTGYPVNTGKIEVGI